MRKLGGALLFGTFVLGACVPDAEAENGVDTGQAVAVIDGTYDQRRDQCSNVNSETRLTINGGTFQFYESQCTFGRKGGQASASEGTLICMGEGQRFNRDIALNVQTDGLQIVENDTALNYTRCPD